MKYGFIFDPSETWSSQDDFEADLGNLFSARGFDASLIETAEGQENVPIIMIARKEDEINPPVEAEVKKVVKDA